MKRLFAVIVILLSLVGCSDKESSEVMLFTKPNLVFPKSGGEPQSVGLIYSGAWSVDLNEIEWITKVEPMSGEGNGTIIITIEENNDGARRDAVIYINEQPFKIIQEFQVIPDISAIYGNWKTTEGKEFDFTFNEDKSCKALVNGVNYTGTYAVVDNVVTITVLNSPMPIVITVSEVSSTEMIAESFGQTLTLTKY